ncbi:hypothetical protein BDV26DRAFT_269597 [Aspergillus bertholletiae]|uniref:Uncharacterized protein n=1 Tax=Aspergillus bertholletiae TaxID=1226010 RepID=A0A5N7AZT9_9EURO|nr:hypothetical protein BDV26DRAFT_269597 [Aspergillus bertholletiae]
MKKANVIHVLFKAKWRHFFPLKPDRREFSSAVLLIFTAAWTPPSLRLANLRCSSLRNPEGWSRILSISCWGPRSSCLMQWRKIHDS